MDMNHRLQSDSGFPPEKWLILLMLIVVLAFHVFFLARAGPLWRDEANSLLQSRLPDWHSILATLQYDSFPVLYPFLLRTWTSLPGVSGDFGIRLSGALVGLGLFGSIWKVARMLGVRLPLVSILLLAANPLLVAEGDSIRPYGIGLLWLVWVLCFLGKYLLDNSVGWLWLGTLASILAVHSTYTNALFVCVLSVSAAGVSVMQSRLRAAGLVLVPGFAAALSLLFYVGVLRRAGAWAALVHYHVDWWLFFRDIVSAFSFVFPALWLVFTAFAIGKGIHAVRRVRGSIGQQSPVLLYTTIAGAFGAVVQIVFIEVVKVPPFPRYFLSSLVLIAFAVEQNLMRAGRRILAAAVLIAIIVIIPPSLSWLCLRRTNADQIAAVLSREAGPHDLVLISPWFLHPSFQHYYRGSCDWATIPPLERQPMMRYDLVKRAILRADADDTIVRLLQAVTARNGSIWFVSQAVAGDALVSEAPVRPRIPNHPDGYDYVRFRSYWERDVVFRLGEFCARRQWPLPDVGRVWSEEHLVLSRWSSRERQHDVP